MWLWFKCASRYWKSILSQETIENRWREQYKCGSSSVYESIDTREVEIA